MKANSEEDRDNWVKVIKQEIEKLGKREALKDIYVRENDLIRSRTVSYTKLNFNQMREEFKKKQNDILASENIFASKSVKKEKKKELPSNLKNEEFKENEEEKVEQSEQNFDLIEDFEEKKDDTSVESKENSIKKEKKVTRVDGRELLLEDEMNTKKSICYKCCAYLTSFFRK